MTGKRVLSFLSALSFLAVVHGCGPSLRELAISDFENQIKSFKTIGVTSPDMLMYELTTGGMRELMDEWCETARKNFFESITRELKSASVDTRFVAWQKETEAEMEDVYYLFRAVSRSMQLNSTYRKLSDCADEQTCKDYAVGPLDRVLTKYDVNALLLVFGMNEIESAGRTKARKASRAVAIASAFGPVRLAPVRNPGTFVSMALVDRSGTVLWHTNTLTGKGFDLRDAQRVDEMTKRMVARLPIWSKK